MVPKLDYFPAHWAAQPTMTQGIANQPSWSSYIPSQIQVGACSGFGVISVPLAAFVCVFPYSDELWRRYSAASSTHKPDEAFENFAAYVREWLESRGKAVAPSPMISSSCDRYGTLKPCIA